MMGTTNKIMITLFLLTLFASAGCGSGDSNAPAIAQSEVAEGGDEAKTIVLSPDQIAELKIETMQVKKGDAIFYIVVPGIVRPAPDGISFLSAPVAGRVSKIFAHEGEKVRKGDLLAELESLEYANLLADFLQANAQLNYTKKQHERLQTLVDQKISSQQDLDRIEAEYDRFHASLMSSQARLKAVGVTDKELRSWAQDGTPDANLKIRATLTGTINDHFIDLGQSVKANDNLLSIINMAEILIVGFVPPEDVTFIEENNAITVSQVTAKGKEIRAKIKSMRPTLDPQNRSINIYALAKPIDGWPMPGENVRLEIEAAVKGELIVIPSSSIAYYGQDPIVFVQTNENTYSPRVVRIFRETPGHIILESGLADNEIIATSQVFSLKALMKYELFAE